MDEESQKKILEILSKPTACYVLVTASEPSDEGEMQVDMTYEGDPALAAYLLEGAQRFIDDHEDGGHHEPSYPQPKLHSP